LKVGPVGVGQPEHGIDGDDVDSVFKQFDGWVGSHSDGNLALLSFLVIFDPTRSPSARCRCEIYLEISFSTSPAQGTAPWLGSIGSMDDAAEWESGVHTNVHGATHAAGLNRRLEAVAKPVVWVVVIIYHVLLSKRDLNYLKECE